MAYGLKVFAELFAVRGHALKKIPLKKLHVLTNAATKFRKSLIHVLTNAANCSRFRQKVVLVFKTTTFSAESKKCLVFRFAERVRQDFGPNNDANCRTALARDLRNIMAFSNHHDPPQAESYSLVQSPA